MVGYPVAVEKASNTFHARKLSQPQHIPEEVEEGEPMLSSKPATVASVELDKQSSATGYREVDEFDLQSIQNLVANMTFGADLD